MRLLSLSLLLALADAALAQGETAVVTLAPAPACPVGVIRCPKPTDPFARCKRNDLFDFFVPGLPPAGDRSKAQTTADANHVTWLDNTHAKLEDNPQIQRLDALLRADVITYNSTTTDYTADGHVRYQDAGMLMSADHARGKTDPQSTWLDNVRYQLLDKRGNGVAATVNQTDPDHSALTLGTFSTCDPSERQWEIRAKDMAIDKTDNVGRGHGVTIAYQGVPFFWFPYLSWPLSSERESGFLAPSIGYSDRRGLKLGIPYYFDLAPNYDATLRATEFTKRGPMLGGEFRYLSNWDKLQLDFAWLPHDDESDHSNRGFVRVQDTASFSPNWGANVDIHHVSDDQYLHDFGDSFLTTAVSLLQSNAYVNGHGDWWSTSIGGDAWQVTDPSLKPFCATPGVPLSNCASPIVFKPYTRLPRLTFNAREKAAGFELGFDSEFVNFKRDYSLTGQRIDLYPHVAYALEGSSYFVRPELGYRYTGYELHDFLYANNPAIKRTSPSRSLPIFSLDSGMVFERELTLFDTPLTQTLEPRVFYLYVPYRNQSNLPVFDTQLPSFDFPSLFRTNAFVGADRQVNANNATVALTSRLIDGASGDQLLSGSIGQIHRFNDVRVSLPGAPDLNLTGKDIVGELDLRLGKTWDFTWDQQWNPNPRTIDPLTGKYIANNHHTDLSAVGVQHRFGADGVFNFSYRFRRGFLEQVDATALVPINERWSVIGRYYYSLLDSRLLEAFGGVQYDSCCVAARVVVRRFLNNVTYGQFNTIANARPSNAVFFELEFNGLGSSGHRTENFLRRAMLGYQ